MGQTKLQLELILKRNQLFYVEQKFNPVALRESCTPKLYRRDMATKMGISCTYLQHMEQGIHPFAQKWKVRFMEELEKYKANPDPENQYRKRWERWRMERDSLKSLTPKESAAIELGA